MSTWSDIRSSIAINAPESDPLQWLQDTDEFLELVTNLTYKTPPGIAADSLYDYLCASALQA